ncbi:MAG: hypothetical protein U0531_19420 [Dehalococcoidia bacterium]
MPAVDLGRCVRETGARAVCLSVHCPPSGWPAPPPTCARWTSPVTIFAGGAAIEGFAAGRRRPPRAPLDAAGAIVAAAR